MQKRQLSPNRKALFDLTVMPFGLCNAPVTFERLMESVLAGLHWQIYLIYLYDVIVIGKNFKDMIKDLSHIFDRLLEAGLKLKSRNATHLLKELNFLDT